MRPVVPSRRGGAMGAETGLLEQHHLLADDRRARFQHIEVETTGQIVPTERHVMNAGLELPTGQRLYHPTQGIIDHEAHAWTSGTVKRIWVVGLNGFG